MTDALLVLAGPLAAFALLSILPPLRRSGKPAAAVSIAGIGVSLLAAVALFARIRAAGAPSILEIVWAPMTTGPSISFGLLADGISASMAVLVAFVALLVQVYSLSYMSDELDRKSVV